ncbi:ubiquionol cytochrome c reductase hinge [Fusarium longipes]|uniref:Cytochrome b-c1 complex subunit 6, mitochondrial n=1 Tax=Fusarium longipes TaxID=694270 RepID=A0A395SYS3_9HYPO|nr:ubiquionol cytochrome c reductase hinge [Fusarium longipes]
MGIWDAFTDIVEAVTPWSVVEAEAPVEEPQRTECLVDSIDLVLMKWQEENESKTESKDEPEEEEAEEEEEEEEEEDEDDEEELVDPKETLEEECKNSPQCAPAKHHFDECVERVQQQESEGGAKEDCVEEFFHLAHCATACAAPKLWSQLK